MRKVVVIAFVSLDVGCEGLKVLSNRAFEHGAMLMCYAALGVTHA